MLAALSRKHIANAGRLGRPGARPEHDGPAGTTEN